MLLDILVVLLLIALNGYFAMSELAVVSSRKARLQQMSERRPGARVALRLMEEPSRFLSTVQIGITLIGVLAGAFSGATIADKIGNALERWPAVAPYGDAIGITVVVAAITYLSLIFGELVPKRLALADPESVASRVARPMDRLATVARPVVWLLGASSNLVLRLLGQRDRAASTVTEEEIRHMVEEGAHSGAIETVERDMVRRVFRLGDKTVGEIMTPRVQIVWLDADLKPEENLRRVREAGHSRFPVTRGEKQEVVGILQLKDVIDRLGGGSLDLFGALREPLFVPETTPALKLLEMFKSQALHIALVVDEYGEVQGVVTPNDIFESVVGEVAGEVAPGEEPVRRREDGTLLIDGTYGADELRDLLALSRLPGEDEHDFNTIAGLLLANLGRIPATGEIFEWHGWRFEVIDMDGPRIDKVLVHPPKTPPPEPML